MYVPLDVGGLRRLMWLMKASTFSASLASSKLTLPTGAWMLPPSSLRNSTLPAAYSFTAVGMSSTTVPDLGEGILPCGPRIRPSLDTLRIMAGVATATSKSVQPSEIFLIRSSPPASMAPAALARATSSPSQKAMTFLLTPMPVRQAHGPAQGLVGLLDVDAQVHDDVHGGVELGGGQRLEGLDRFGHAELAGGNLGRDSR